MGGRVEDRQPKPAQFRPVRSPGIVMSPKTTLSSLKIITFRIMTNIVLDTAPFPQKKQTKKKHKSVFRVHLFIL